MPPTDGEDQRSISKSQLHSSTAANREDRGPISIAAPFIHRRRPIEVDSPQSVVSPFKNSSVFAETKKKNADLFNNSLGFMSRGIPGQIKVKLWGITNVASWIISGTEAHFLWIMPASVTSISFILIVFIRLLRNFWVFIRGY